jgi:hypothetical protein
MFDYNQLAIPRQAKLRQKDARAFTDIEIYLEILQGRQNGEATWLKS